MRPLNRVNHCRKNDGQGLQYLIPNTPTSSTPRNWDMTPQKDQAYIHQFICRAVQLCRGLPVICQSPGRRFPMVQAGWIMQTWTQERQQRTQNHPLYFNFGAPSACKTNRFIMNHPLWPSNNEHDQNAVLVVLTVRARALNLLPKTRTSFIC